MKQGALGITAISRIKSSGTYLLYNYVDSLDKTQTDPIYSEGNPKSVSSYSHFISPFKTKIKNSGLSQAALLLEIHLTVRQKYLQSQLQQHSVLKL